MSIDVHVRLRHPHRPAHPNAEQLPAALVASRRRGRYRFVNTSHNRKHLFKNWTKEHTCTVVRHMIWYRKSKVVSQLGCISGQSNFPPSWWPYLPSGTLSLSFDLQLYYHQLLRYFGSLFLLVVSVVCKNIIRDNTGRLSLSFDLQVYIISDNTG